MNGNQNNPKISRVIKIGKENGDHRWIVEYTNDTRYLTDYTEVAQFVVKASKGEEIKEKSGRTYTEYKEQ